MFKILLIIGGFFALMVYISFLYLVKSLLELYKQIFDWKILQYMFSIATIGITLWLHYVAIKILFAIFF